MNENSDMTNEEREKEIRIIKVENLAGNALKKMTRDELIGFTKDPEAVDWAIKRNPNIVIKEEEPPESRYSSWEDLEDIDHFVIYEGSERIYEIHIGGRIIKVEGKEIMDYNIFILRFFEATGVMLPTFRGIKSEWARLVTHWNRNYGVIMEQKKEEISELEEAKELIIDYINNSSVAEGYVIKEGIITIREDSIYVPTRIIKKLLKRNSINISMRKLAYIMNNYLISGSIPLKIENKSERFWKFYKCKFEIIDQKKLSVLEEDNE